MAAVEKPAWLPLGALLVRENLITPEQLELALADQQATGLRLGELLIEWGWVASSAVSRALAEQYEMNFLDLDAAGFHPSAAARLSAQDAHARGAIPIRSLDDGRLLVGVADPTNVGACDELRELLGASISLVVVDQLALNRALARAYA
jgi:MSHA biogenesis protein MshE